MAEFESTRPEADEDALPLEAASRELLRIEEAGLNALSTRHQLFYDGWLLRLSPGKAKRGRSVNPHFGSTLPLDAKIAHCERLYASRGLPTLFRITPFAKPAALDAALDARGYTVYEPTLVLVAHESPLPPRAGGDDVAVTPVAPDAFVDAVGTLRGSPRGHRAAHLERLAHSPLAMHAVVALRNGETLACGQVTLDDDLAAIYDMVTARAERGRGLATRIVSELIAWAWRHGATRAFLQVNEDNAPARAVYRKFGFETAYAYHYRARPDPCF
ncbi:MAG: GNAT family N-acetyltransferase [Rudaea sp.]